MMKMKDGCFVNTSHRKGGSILTHTGILFWPMDARPQEVDIEDIAHSLSNMCRFAGHVNQFYSVAQHCVMVSRLVDIKNMHRISGLVCSLAGLLHDASEAYLVDVPRPIKKYLKEYQVIEHHLQDVIAAAFSLHKGTFELPIIKDADNLALAIEAHNLVNDPQKLWSVEARCGSFLKEKIVPLSPTQAKKAFLRRYKEIMQSRIFDRSSNGKSKH